jgi:hypothetical protein
MRDFGIFLMSAGFGVMVVATLQSVGASPLVNLIVGFLIWLGGAIIVQRS